MREEPPLLLLPPFIAENGHTLQATLTTNYQTAITAQYDAQRPSLFLWIEALAFCLFSFASLL